jgi:hypothetical protein
VLGVVGRFRNRGLSADIELPAGLPLPVIGYAAKRGMVDRKLVPRQRHFAENFHLNLPSFRRTSAVTGHERKTPISFAA